MIVLTPIDVLAISPTLISLGSQQLGNNTYNVYTATNLKKGGEIKISFQMQKIWQTDRESNNTTLLIFGLILILLGIVLLVYGKIKRKTEDETERKRGDDWEV